MKQLVHVETLLDQAEAALDAGEAEKALDLCNQVLARAPQHPGAQFVKGDALRVMGDLLEAADAYRSAALVQPDHAVLGRPAGGLERSISVEAAPDHDLAVLGYGECYAAGPVR